MDVSPEARCIVCDQPICDHIPLRYVWRAWWRHRMGSMAGWILGRLPLGGAELD